MTVYCWPAAKVWLITGGSRMEREQVLDERFEGHIICVKVLIDSLLDSIRLGEPLSQWRETYVSAALLALTEVQLAKGKTSHCRGDVRDPVGKISKEQSQHFDR